VLQHAVLFFTHGGINSINEAMYFGVPMLVIFRSDYLQISKGGREYENKK